ncbi:exopolysaccharide biosynthesis polyprenyl glycosylphosphotransferase [Auraticoccus monumenti]|uniref:Exopolysaccharide biosynthesis polyprenyl glycosylphosphotransferase n=1 Tax=Auraticoccus monumenti TaxID=675864 RepID=A0A1G7CRU8_9ACTN|nr:exopolysaccharide biosynthesis polyprenyl glycosylphosphotransferase [Auraticoccus monumenti]SDE42058.1 exopolysaccharide biosynthesis polyprenyl glycosylphosphotransferase [Auraticoccus monumenti]
MTGPADTPTGPRDPRRVQALRWLNRRGVRLLHLLDAASIYLTLWLITGALIVVRRDFNAASYSDRYAWTFAVVVLVHLAVFYFGGLYDRERRLGVRPGAAKIITAVWFASLLVGLISWLAGEYLIPRSVLVVYALLGPFSLGANRWLSRRVRLRSEGPPRVLLVGDPQTVALAEQHLVQAGEGIVVAGHSPSVVDLQQRVREAQATDVVLLDAGALEALYTSAGLADLERDGVSTLQIVRPQDSLLGLRNVGEIGGMPFVLLSAHALTPSQRRLKRWMDVVVLVVTAPITVPVGLFTTLYVAALAGRPLLFVQQRVGFEGRSYWMLKFRTMGVDAERGTGPVQAATDDPRVLPGMAWIRATRLDELPQLLNVLHGSMTIVGPRPERPEEMAAYEAAFPGYRRRHQTLPGITGLAQVYGRYHTAIEYKLGHDLHYLADWSPVVDLQIMLRTVWVIVTRRL